MPESVNRVAELLREALRLGDKRGVRFVRAPHVGEELLSDLASATYEHALAEAEDRGASDGWLTFAGGILPWWQEQGGLTDEESRRLHRFRSDIVDWLEERGMALREDPRATPLLVQPPTTTAASPDWTREEDVLALDLFVRAGALNGGPLPGKTHSEVVALSERLRDLPVHDSALRGEGFRNPAGVALKLANFRATDRDVKLARGVIGAENLPKGMASYGAMDLAVFEDYLDRDFQGLREDALAILATTATFEETVTTPAVEDHSLESNDGATYEAVGTEGGPRSRSEQALVLRYGEWMESQGISVVARWYRIPGVARPLRCDAFVPTRNVLVEAKGSDARASVRMAVGQLLDYRRFEKSVPDLALLLPHEPSRDIRDFLIAVGVGWIWPRRATSGFRDSTGGKYV
jgi:hypothetical protein